MANLHREKRNGKTYYRIQFYDKDGTRFKRLESTKIELISGVPFATHMEMKNLLTGHRSELTFVAPKTNVGITDSKFTERELRKRNF